MPQYVQQSPVLQRVVPGYVARRDPESMVSRLSGAFTGIVDSIGKMGDQRAQNDLFRAQAAKAQAEANEIGARQNAQRELAYRLGYVFSPDMKAAGEMDPKPNGYGSPDYAARELTSSAMSAGVNPTDLARMIALNFAGEEGPAANRFLTNVYPIYSNQSLAPNESVTESDRNTALQVTTDVAKRGQDKQLEGTLGAARINADSREQIAALQAEAADARAREKAALASRPLNPTDNVKAADEARRAVEAELNINRGANELEYQKWYNDPSTRAMLASEEYKRALAVAQRFIVDGMPSRDAGYQAAARVINGRKWNGKEWVIDPRKANIKGVGVDTTAGLPLARGLADYFINNGPQNTVGTSSSDDGVDSLPNPVRAPTKEQVESGQLEGQEIPTKRGPMVVRNGRLYPVGSAPQ